MSEYTLKHSAKEIDDKLAMVQDWELIESIKIEEDGITGIERSQEPDGTPYNFKKMVAYVHHPVSEKTGRTGFRFLPKEVSDSTNSYLSTNSAQALHNTYETDSAFYAEVIKDVLYGTGVTAVSSAPSYESTNLGISNFVPRKYVKMNAITFFRYSSLNGFVLPAGTTMDIYAIRA